MPIETVLKLLRDPRVSALVICAIVFATGFLYTGMLFEWGPDLIRPASAQTVAQQVTTAKREVAAQVAAVQQNVKAISDKQDAQDRRDHADRLERLEQQLLWWRQQNCRSKGAARNYSWETMSSLRERYAALKGSEWQMPSCSDIGE